MPAKTYDNTVFRVICNQVGDGDNEAGHTFEGLIFVCDPADKLMASSKDGIAEEIESAEIIGSDPYGFRPGPIAVSGEDVGAA